MSTAPSTARNDSSGPAKAIIIGATSGLGKALAIELHQRGYQVGITGRRTERLKEISETLGSGIYYAMMDVTKPENSIDILQKLIDQMGGMDLIVLNAGVGRSAKELEWRWEQQTIDVNVRGFATLAAWSFNYFEERGHGHIAGVSSISQYVGFGLASAYTASKAFVANYLQGYRQRANHSSVDITVTTLIPGFVHTEMTQHNNRMFWVATAEKAARQMANAIEKGRSRAYITRRWSLVAIFLRWVPNWLVDRI